LGDHFEEEEEAAERDSGSDSWEEEEGVAFQWESEGLGAEEAEEGVVDRGDRNCAWWRKKHMDSADERCFL